MPLQHIFWLLREYHNISIWLLREYMPLQHIYFWLLREYMPLQHIYLVTKRIHAITTYLFGY